MGFNFKKRVFVSIFLSAGVILSSPLAFASGKPSGEKKPSKSSSSKRKDSGIGNERTIFSMLKKLVFSKSQKAVEPELFMPVETGKVIEPKQFSSLNFSSNKIILPQAVRLKFGSFSECLNLTDIRMPAVKEIGWFAFMGCTNLKNVEMPNVEEVSCSAFLDCSNLEKVDLKKVKKISDNAFLGCKNLKEVVISDEVSFVSKDAFYACSDELRIIYKNSSLSKEEFFEKFKGNTSDNPTITEDEINRLFFASQK